MSISSELLTLQNTKTAIRTAINNKGGSVGASDTFASYATAIDNLPSGGDDSTLRDLIERDITSITIPSGTTSIGNNAFSFCSSLTSVTIPNSVTTIGNAAFQGCGSFTSITIPNNVTSIGNFAFQSCTSFTSITIPNNVTSIGNNAFDYCTSLTSATIGNSVTSIGDAAFNGCTRLTSIIIPSSVTTIGSRAFQGCSSLTSVTLNATTPPTIGVGTYYGSFNGTYPIYVPAESVDAYKAATNWSTYASRIFAIEDSITFTPTNGDPAISVKNYELATANYVQSTDVPSTIKNGAGSLEIGEGVTRIGAFAFQNGSSLTSATLPSTLTSIDEAILMGCTSLTGITVNATTPPTLAGAAFTNTNNCPIYVPAASVDTYKAATNWSTYASRIQAIPVDEHDLILPSTINVSLSNDVDMEEFVANIPITVYYADGEELTIPYYNSTGNERSVILDEEGWCSATLSDGETDVSDYFGAVAGEITPGTYTLQLWLSDDNETLVDWAVAGETITADINITLPENYINEGGTWVKQHDQEARVASLTINLTA